MKLTIALATFFLAVLLASCGAPELDYEQIKTEILTDEGALGKFNIGDARDEIKGKLPEGFEIEDDDPSELLRTWRGDLDNHVSMLFILEEGKMVQMQCVVRGEIENAAKNRQFMSDVFDHYSARYEVKEEGRWGFKAENGTDYIISCVLDSIVMGGETESIEIRIMESRLK